MVHAKKGFPNGSVVKNLPANAGDLGLIPGSGRSPGEENGNPLQYSGLENPMDRSLVGYRPGGHKRVRHNLVTKKQQYAKNSCKKKNSSFILQIYFLKYLLFARDGLGTWDTAVSKADKAGCP